MQGFGSVINKDICIPIYLYNESKCIYLLFFKSWVFLNCEKYPIFVPYFIFEKDKNECDVNLSGLYISKANPFESYAIWLH